MHVFSICYYNLAMKKLFLLLLITPMITQADNPICERRRYGFSLRPIKEGRVSSLYRLMLGNGQKAKVRLRYFEGREGKDTKGKPFYLSGNCFAFASHQPRNIPG